MHPSCDSLPIHRRVLWVTGNRLYDTGRHLIDNHPTRERVGNLGGWLSLTGITLRTIARRSSPGSQPPIKRAKDPLR